jgi:hypothetical protein
MGKPITTKSAGICFAFPNVCLTPTPTPTPAPIPYPSIGQLSAAEDFAATVKAGGNQVITGASRIKTTTGDAAGSLKGVISHTVGGSVLFPAHSNTVFAEGSGVVRMFDTTKQNCDAAGTANASGQVLGGFATVLVGD